MDTTGVFSALRTTLTGLSAQMKRLNVISENIANAESMPDKDGNVYHKKRVVETSRKEGNHPFKTHMALSLNRSNRNHLSSGSGNSNSVMKGMSSEKDFKVIEIEGEKLIHDPNHPLADKNGYIKMPNVNVVEEMTELIAASRSYEANITILNAAKSMAKKSFEI